MVDVCCVSLLREASNISAELSVVEAVLRTLNLFELEGESVCLELCVDLSGSPVAAG